MVAMMSIKPEGDDNGKTVDANGPQFCGVTSLPDPFRGL
jgi:hypothetical protein